MKLEGPRPHHRRHVPRPHEAVEPQVGRLQQRPQRRHDQHVVAHAGEVPDALGLGALQRQRGRGGGGLEADREEHHLAVGVLAGDPQRVERRVDHPHVGALGLRLEQRPLGAGDAHHVAEAREDDARLAGDRDAVVNAPHRDDAHRAARPVHQLHVGRQQVVDPVLVDGVRVPAAHLHHLVVPPGLDGREDLARQRAAQGRVAELLDEPHAAPPPRRAARSPRRRAPGARRRARRPPPARRPPRPRTPLPSTQSARPSAAMPTTVTSTPSSAQVMHPWSVAQKVGRPSGAIATSRRPHSIRLWRSSSSSCS